MQVVQVVQVVQLERNPQLIFETGLLEAWSLVIRLVWPAWTICLLSFPTLTQLPKLGFSMVKARSSHLHSKRVTKQLFLHCFSFSLSLPVVLVKPKVCLFSPSGREVGFFSVVAIFASDGVFCSPELSS